MTVSRGAMAPRVAFPQREVTTVGPSSRVGPRRDAEPGRGVAEIEPLIPRPSSHGLEGCRPGTADRHRGWLGSLSWFALAGAFATYVGLLFVGFTSALGVATVSLALVVILPWLSRVGARASTFDLGAVFRLALALKLLATLPRFLARDDAFVYHRVGALLADRFRSLDLTPDTGRSIPGTGAVRYATGLVEVVTLEDEFATFVVFSLMGFVGMVWFVQAFRMALPGVSARRYALLVLCWPSLLYWPSSIGKEAMMLLALGGAARGMASLLQGHRTGLLWLGGGLALSILVRPHVGMIVVTAAVCALVIRGRDAVPRNAGLTGRVLVVGVLLFAGSITADAMERVLDIDGLDPSGIDAALDLAESRSAQGGSSFESARIDSILEFPEGFVTVLFRPFPTEAPTPAMLLTAIEGGLLAGLLIAALPRIAAGLRMVRSEAYSVYCAAFVAVFVYLFSAIANFGILARQRTAAVPLVLALVALPTAQERVRSRRADKPVESADSIARTAEPGS
jgi:hypothetical protein